MAQINAYVGFNGQCREAMTFYKECMGGELTIMPVKGSPGEAHCPDGIKDGILHSSLVNKDLVLMGTDMTGPGGYIKGNNIALSVNCTSEEEIHTFFSKLSAGGQVLQPIQKQFWGALFGMVMDKFGLCWMFNYEIKA